MKSRFKVLSLMTAVLLVFGVVGFASADNTTQVVASISYPCGDYTPANQECDTGVAFSRDVGGDVVNIYITLLDANSNPATAGPAGELLATLPIQILTNLGTALPPSLTPNTFVSDSATGALTMNAARANVDYTGATPGTDIITVVVAADPDPIVATASVNVSAPAADGLVVRTYRGVDPPSMIYTDMFADPYFQSDNFGASELAGATVEFTVVAVAGDLYTYAPELEGQEVTVTAYADYSADNNDIGTAPQEMVPLAPTATATFVNGIAEGTITIDKAGPAGLDVVLTAAIEDSLETTQPPVDDTSGGLNDLDQDDVDYVTMQSPSIPTGILIGTDTFGNGNYLMEIGCIQVPDDGTTGPTPVPAPAILVDSRMNAVVSSGGNTVVASLDPALDLLLTDGALIPVGNPLTGSNAWDIAAGDYISTSGDDSLEVIPGVNNVNGLVSGGLTLTSGLLSDGAQAELLTTDGAGGIDFTVTDDTGGVAIDAGDEVTLTLSDIVVAGDSIEITAVAGGAPQLLSLASQDFEDATTTLAIGSVSDADDPPAGDIDVKIRIYGPATTAVEAADITVTVTSKCNIAATTTVLDVEPLEEVLLNVVAVDSDPDNAVDLSANPVVVTKQFIADDTAQDLIDAGDLQTLDMFANVVDPTPDVTATSFRGSATIPGGNAVEISYSEADVGETDTVGVTTVGSNLTRDFEIGDIILEGPSAAVPTAILVRQEGPQSVGGALIAPAAGGEAIIRISSDAAGPPNTVSAQINLTGEEGQPLPELRSLTGNVNQPSGQMDDFTLDLAPPVDTRYVVSGSGRVEISVIDKNTTDPLTTGTLTVDFGAVGEPCEVAISPATALVLPGDALTFTAETTCGGVVQALAAAPNYTWAISEAGCTGGSIDAATGTYTAGADDNACADTIMATDTANGGAEATATINVSSELPSVSITGPATLGPPCPASDTYTAETTIGDSSIDGTYTWELDGVSSGTGNTGNTFDVECTEDGTKTLMVTDTANGNITASMTITCECEVVPTEGIVATFTPLPLFPNTGCGKRFATGFGQVTIQGIGTSFNLLTTVGYDSLQVIKGLRVVDTDTQTITQIVGLFPSLDPFLPVLLPAYPNTVTVTVTDLSDTFEIPACEPLFPGPGQ